MKEITVFNFENSEIRSIIDEKGNPWFVAKEVIEILGIKSQAHALRKLDDDEKGGGVIIQSPGGNQEFATINESGLYTLILQSRKPEAKKFKKWITSEVLPKIRKNGSYSIKPLSPIDQLVANALALKEQDDRLRRQELEAASQRETLNTVATNLLTVAKEQENDTLTSDQITQLDAVIHERYKQCGNGKIAGLIKRAIKERFFEITTTRTYKEIPRWGFEEAMKIARGYFI